MITYYVRTNKDFHICLFDDYWNWIGFATSTTQKQPNSISQIYKFHACLDAIVGKQNWASNFWYPPETYTPRYVFARSFCEWRAAREREKNHLCVCVMFDLTWEQNTSIGMLKIDIYRFLLNRICWRMLKLIALRFCQCLLFQAGEKFAY